MIGLRVTCDADDCGRHFDVGGHELAPRPGPTLRVAAVRSTLVLTAPYVVLPAGWASAGDDRVLCREHVLAGTP